MPNCRSHVDEDGTQTMRRVKKSDEKIHRFQECWCITDGEMDNGCADTKEMTSVVSSSKQKH